MVVFSDITDVAHVVTYIPEEIYVFDATNNIEDRIDISGDFNQVHLAWDKFFEDYKNYEINEIEIDTHKDELRLILEKKRNDLDGEGLT